MFVIIISIIMDVIVLINLLIIIIIVTIIISSSSSSLYPPNLSSPFCPIHYLMMYFLCFSAPGETVSIAEEMAARDALKNIFGTADNRPPLALGNAGRELHIAPEYLQPNPSIQSISLNRIQ